MPGYRICFARGVAESWFDCIFTFAKEAVVLAKWLESIIVWIADQNRDDEHAQLLHTCYCYGLVICCDIFVSFYCTCDANKAPCCCVCELGDYEKGNVLPQQYICQTDQAKFGHFAAGKLLISCGPQSKLDML